MRNGALTRAGVEEGRAPRLTLTRLDLSLLHPLDAMFHAAQ